MRQGVTVGELLSHLTILETIDPVNKQPIILLSCYTAVMNANAILQVFIALTNYFFFNCHQIVTSMNSAQKRTNRNLIGTMMNACHSLDL